MSFLCRPIHASRLYRLTLAGAAPAQIATLPAEPWPGDATQGQRLMDSTFRFSGLTVHGDRYLWVPEEVGGAWQAALNRFDWLCDIRAIGGEAARIRARELVASWIGAELAYAGVPWIPEVAGGRIANWLAHAAYLCEGAEAEFATALSRSLSRQARHLARIHRLTAPGAQRITVLKGLILATLCLSASARALPRWLKRLDDELAVQVLDDGGHVSRSPAQHLGVVLDLVDLRDALRHRGQVAPDGLLAAIDRMAPMLRFFRHGDGGLALFNGGNEGAYWLIDRVLSRAAVRGRAPDSAPRSGFERLAAGRTVVLVDVGVPPPPGQDAAAHAGTLSFELSVGRERVIVNCGAFTGGTGDRGGWSLASRATAAHSTLTVEDISSSELPSTGIGARPQAVESRREEADGNIWLDASHDGYRRGPRLIHRRRLYLSVGGNELRGEDSLVPTSSARRRREHKFTVRFHLHPSVRASLVNDAAAVLIAQPSGSGWRLNAAGGRITIAESVYLGTAGDIRRTSQIVISGETASGRAEIKWAFTRVPSA